MINNNIKLIATFALALLTTATVCAQQAWWNNDWACRRALTVPAAEGGVQPEIGSVIFTAKELLADHGEDLRVFTAAGKEVQFVKVEADPSSGIRLLIKIEPGVDRYYVYYGNPAAKEKVYDWMPETGIRMLFVGDPQTSGSSLQTSTMCKMPKGNLVQDCWKAKKVPAPVMPEPMLETYVGETNFVGPLPKGAKHVVFKFKLKVEATDKGIRINRAIGKRRESAVAVDGLLFIDCNYHAISGGIQQVWDKVLALAPGIHSIVSWGGCAFLDNTTNGFRTFTHQDVYNMPEAKVKIGETEYINNNMTQAYGNVVAKLEARKTQSLVKAKALEAEMAKLKGAVGGLKGDAKKVAQQRIKALPKLISDQKRMPDIVDLRLYWLYTAAIISTAAGQVPATWKAFQIQYEKTNWENEWRAFGGGPSHRNRSKTQIILPFALIGHEYPPDHFEPKSRQPIVYWGTTLIGTVMGEMRVKGMWSKGFGQPITSSPVCIGGRAIFGTHVNSVVAIDMITSRQIWAAPTGLYVRSSPALWSGRVYVGCNDNKLYCILGSSGKILWTYETQGWIESSPAIADGVVFVGSYDHHLYAIDARTGKLKWKLKTGFDVASSPTIAGPNVLVSSDDGHVYCVNRADGKVKWKYKIGGFANSMPVVKGNVVYAASTNGNVCAVNLQNGQKVWQITLPNKAEVIYPPFAAGNALLVLGGNDFLYALDFSNGNKLAEFNARAHSTWGFEYPAGAPVVTTQGAFFSTSGFHYVAGDFRGRGCTFRLKVKN